MVRPLAMALANQTSSRLDALIARFINDPRDTPFVKLSVMATLIVVPFAAILFVPGVFRWWLVAIYWVVNFRFLDRFILMLHNTSHRTLYKPRYRWLNAWIPYVLGPLFGETPGSYFAHHIGMHHPENNLAEDLSSTMEYRRDSAADFLRYFGRFMWRGLVDLARYLGRKKRTKLLQRLLVGELSFYVFVGALMFVEWRAALVVFVVPVLVVRFLMMAGNWGQHAFVCAEQPESPYRNSITVVRCSYNERCFNDGYHIGHHVKATRHFSEMPADFEANVAEYAKNGAIVFERIDFFGVWALLMLRQYGRLARHYVALEGARPSESEIVELLSARTRPIPHVARQDAALAPAE